MTDMIIYLPYELSITAELKIRTAAKEFLKNKEFEIWYDDEVWIDGSYEVGETSLLSFIFDVVDKENLLFNYIS